MKIKQSFSDFILLPTHPTNAGLGSQLLDTVELRLSIVDDLLIKFRFENFKLGKVGGIPTGTNRDGIRAVHEPFARALYV